MYSVGSIELGRLRADAAVLLHVSRNADVSRLPAQAHVPAHGGPFEKYFAAKDWLTTTTLALSAVSESRKSRPAKRDAHGLEISGRDVDHLSGVLLAVIAIDVEAVLSGRSYVR